MTLAFDYTASKFYTEQIGLVWLGDAFVAAADADALRLGMTQEQVDVMLRHALWHIKTVMSPKTYKPWGRLLLALYFLTGWMPKMRAV